MDDNIDHLQDQEEAEEALSLSDLPLTTDEPHDREDNEDSQKFNNSQSPSGPTDFFEFFSDLSSEMSHAEDIIFCGKIRPFNEHSLSTQTQKPINTDENKQSFNRRRSESMSELKTSRSSSTKTRAMRNSRSLDYKNLRRTSSSTSETSEIYQNSSGKSSGRSDISGQKVPKPRWYVLMFRLVKFPPEMDLRDIKNRQVRRNPAVLFPSFEAGQKVPVNRSGRKSSWGLLRVLSCKGPASVAVTASFGCMSDV